MHILDAPQSSANTRSKNADEVNQCKQQEQLDESEMLFKVGLRVSGFERDELHQ